MSIRRAFAQYKPGYISVNDVSRILTSDGITAFAMANAYDGIFSTCFPAASRLFLDLFESSWLAPQPDLETSLHLGRSFKNAAQRFFVEVSPLLEPEHDERLGPAVWVSATVVVVSGRTATCAWIGTEQAFVLSEGRCIALNDCDTRFVSERQKFWFKGHSLDRKKLGRSMIRIIEENADLEPQTVDWAFLTGYQLLLTSSQWPTLIPLSKLSQLLDQSEESLNAWCRARENPYFCIIAYESEN